MLEIIVPATSANIGPGFDCLGIALNLYNKFYFEEIKEGLIIKGCDNQYQNDDNLIYKSMKYFYEKINPPKIPTGIKITIDSSIPISRGLGSSASCIVAGVLAANHLSNSLLTPSELLQIATEIEGHPDNVSAALFGNMVVSVMDNNQVYYNIIKIPTDLKFCAMIPEFGLSTEESRSVLPKTIQLKDGVYNISRASLLISSILNQNYDLLKIACKDALHQNYRGKLINNYNEIVRYCNNLDSLAVFLSGAGPTIMSILNNNNIDFIDNMNSFLKQLPQNWHIESLSCDTKGAILNEFV